MAALSPTSPPAVSPLAAAPLAGATAEPSALGAEGAIVAEAVTQLRRKHDPAAALAALDEHAAQFTGGAFTREAATLRAMPCCSRNVRRRRCGCCVAGAWHAGARRELRLLRALSCRRAPTAA
jgi:hypothetical protein